MVGDTVLTTWRGSASTRPLRMASSSTEVPGSGVGMAKEARSVGSSRARFTVRCTVSSVSPGRPMMKKARVLSLCRLQAAKASRTWATVNPLL